MKLSAIAFVLTLVATLTTDVVAAPVENEVERGQEDNAELNVEQDGLIIPVIITAFGSGLPVNRKAGTSEESNGLIAIVIITTFDERLPVHRKGGSSEETSGLSASVRWVDPVLLFELMGLGLSWEQAVALLAQ